MNPWSLKSVLVLLAQILSPFGQTWVFHNFGWVFHKFSENGEFYIHTITHKNRDACTQLFCLKKPICWNTIIGRGQSNGLCGDGGEKRDRKLRACWAHAPVSWHSSGMQRWHQITGKRKLHQRPQQSRYRIYPINNQRLGRYSEKQNGNFEWNFPWRGAGVSSSIKVFFNFCLLKTHLESLPDCQNAFCT